MELLNHLIDQYNIPLLSAFLLGIMTSLSPCPLATNITAVAYMSREIKSLWHTLLSGLFYTLGRMTGYTSLAILIYFGFSTFEIANSFQGWGDKILGPILILISLMMLGVIKLKIAFGGDKIEKAKIWFTHQGQLGTFLLGVLFSLAFCPYSGVLFFGILIPLVLTSNEGLLLPPIFSLGTGLPVVMFTLIIVFSFKNLSKIFNFMSRLEKIIRYGTATIFFLTGLYYTHYLIQYLINL